jgi:NADP-reducing hydrogenase subunit HndB
VSVTQTGCIGLCEHEPIVEVVIGDQPKVYYRKVNAEVAEPDHERACARRQAG